MHYHLDSSKLGKLGWREEVSWDEGIKKTIAWYKVNSGNWGDLSSALVAHPRRGLTPSEIAGEVSALATPKPVAVKPGFVDADDGNVLESSARKPSRLSTPQAV